MYYVTMKSTKIGIHQCYLAFIFGKGDTDLKGGSLDERAKDWFSVTKDGPCSHFIYILGNQQSEMEWWTNQHGIWV